MSLVVETGSGSATANSYNDAAGVTVLLVGTPYAATWEALEDKDSAAIAATIFMDIKFRYYGQTLFTIQALQWPRTKNLDGQGNPIAPGTMPLELLKAHALVSGMMSQDPDLFGESFEGQIPLKQFTSDTLSLQFGDPTKGSIEQVLGARFTGVELLIRPIGTRKDGEFLDTSKQSIVRR